MSWLQVDDLRLALQHSHVALPEGTDALYFFLQTPDVWRMPPEQLRDRLIAVGQVMSDAIEIVVAHHVGTEAPIVIEGDGIIPALFGRPGVQAQVNNGQVAGVFVVEPDEDQLRATCCCAHGVSLCGRNWSCARRHRRSGCMGNG